MSANRESKRTFGINDLVSVESLGSAVFLTVVACFCFLVIVGGLSRIHTHSTAEVFEKDRRPRATQIEEPPADLCGAAVTGATQAPPR